MKALVSLIATTIMVLSFILLSCESKVKNTSTPHSKVHISQAFSITDTVSYYYKLYGNRAKIIIDSPASILYIDSVNNTQIAVVNFEDSVTEVFKYQNENWQLTDSATDIPSIWSIDEVNLNGDDFKDLRLMFPVMRGNFVCQVLLYNSLKNEFHFNKNYSKMNVGYDVKTGFVRSCGLGGIYDNSKELYRISTDSLVFYKGVNESLSGTEKYGSYLSLYESRKGHRKLIKTVKGTGTKINQLFERSLWDSYLDYFFVNATEWNEQ